MPGESTCRSGVSVAIHHTGPSLVSSVGCFGLGSIWEAGDGNSLGVTPSISRRPFTKQSGTSPYRNR
jgi:hypothetical protein